MNNLTRIIRYNKPNPKIIPKIVAIMLNTIICVWLIFAFPLSVYASEHGGGGSTSDSITNWTDEQKADYFKTNFSRLIARFVGVIRGSDSTDSVFNSFKNLYYTDTIQQNMTWEQWLSQDLGWTFDDKGEPTITLSVNCLNAMQQAVDKWIDTQGYFYAYTCNILDYYDSFTKKSDYDNLINLIKSNTYVFYYSTDNVYTTLNNDYSFVCRELFPNYNQVKLSAYDSNWVYHSADSFTYYNLSDSSVSSWNPRNYYWFNARLTSDITKSLGNIFIFTYGQSKIKVYRNLESLKADSVGTQTYYVTNDYSKGATYNTTKTIDNSTIQNTISYENVQNYNQQYYDEHNTTANYEIINNYITNYYETINNNGGSGGNGSGGGSDDSGGGIFDWLGSVGDILGSLIKGLGEMVVGLLDGITTVITSFIDKLPTQVNNLFGTLFDWLPPEIRSLIVLSITLSLIWGIIKLIRG